TSQYVMYSLPNWKWRRMLISLLTYTPDPVGRDRRTRDGLPPGEPHARSVNRLHPQTELRKGWNPWQSRARSASPALAHQPEVSTRSSSSSRPSPPTRD